MGKQGFGVMIEGKGPLEGRRVCAWTVGIVARAGNKERGWGMRQFCESLCRLSGLR